MRRPHCRRRALRDAAARAGRKARSAAAVRRAHNCVPARTLIASKPQRRPAAGSESKHGWLPACKFASGVRHPATGAHPIPKNDL
ncbi:MAG: hypothetical protein DWI67_08400 [Chloroflexi bacterium]|nr:MAG: hypothetical protein DWI67_08400 [Chloroflexota bacterium]